MATSLHWRTLLFVPANNTKLILSATKRGADAIILDLEDAVVPEAKAEARLGLLDAIRTVRGQGIDVVIRVNSEITQMLEDIKAIDLTQVSAILVPKCDDSFRVTVADELISSFVIPGSSAPRIIALVESPKGILNLSEIAQSSERLAGLLFGSEDYSAALETAPTEAILTAPALQLAMVAAAYGLLAIGLVGSLADYSDLVLFERRVLASRAVGLKAAAVIHPSQVAIANSGFSPTQIEIEHATRVVEAFEEAKADGKGAIAVAGKMVDEPVYRRAKAMVTRNFS